jgi:hypothetical protein
MLWPRISAPAEGVARAALDVVPANAPVRSLGPERRAFSAHATIVKRVLLIEVIFITKRSLGKQRPMQAGRPMQHVLKQALKGSMQ